MFSRKSPQQFFEEGRSFLDNEKYDEAINAFTKVIELAPTSYESYANRGLAYVNKVFATIDTISDEQRESYAEKYLFESIRNFDKAIDILTVVIRSHESEKELLAQVFIFRAQSNYFVRKITEAFSDLNSALKYDNNNPEIFQKRGMLYLDELDDPELAIEDFSKAIRIQPSAQVYICRCWAYMENKDPDAAVKDYKRAKALDINFVKNSQRTRSLFKLRQWEQFMEEADKLLF